MPIFRRTDLTNMFTFLYINKLCWNVNRKSYALYGTVTLLMTFSDPNHPP